MTWHRLKASSVGREGDMLFNGVDVASDMASMGLVIVIVVCQRSCRVYGMVQAKDIKRGQE